MTCSVWRIVSWSGAVGLLLLVSGCSKGDLVDIQGEVTLDGKPIEKGTIDFYPADGSGPTAGTVIERGQYQLEIHRGAKSVRIQGYRKVGQEHAIPNDPTSPLVDINEPIVPTRYNASSELTCQIAQGTRTLDFRLSTR